MTRHMYWKLWDALIAEGVVCVTTEELIERTGASRTAIHAAVARAQEEGMLLSPTRGLYVLIPPEYRTWRVVPAEWFIDDMMRHLSKRYYLAFLTAAARHGASHQATHVTRVAVDARVRNRDIDGVRLRFHTVSDFDHRRTVTHTGPSGTIQVSTPETTVLDIAERTDLAGGVGMLLEVLPELPVDADELADLAAFRTTATVRRTGWILSRTHPALDLRRLAHRVGQSSANPTPLVLGGREDGEIDRAWGVVVNSQVRVAS